jgi:hypothetical protein
MVRVRVSLSADDFGVPQMSQHQSYFPDISTHSEKLLTNGKYWLLSLASCQSNKFRFVLKCYTAKFAVMLAFSVPASILIFLLS